MKDSGLLLERVSETIKAEAKEQKGGFLSMLLGTLGSILLENMLADNEVIRAGERTARIDYGSKKYSFKKFFLIRSHPLTNFDTQVYYQNQPRFNGVYSRNNLPDKIKDGSYVLNLGDYSDIGTHWIALYANNKTMAYFDSFGIEHIPKEIKKFINNKNIIANIFRLQSYDSVMFGYFCIRFIYFMLKGNNLADFTNFFSPNDFIKNDDIILNYFLTNL